MAKAVLNEMKISDLSELHEKVRNKLFPDKAISQSENRETYRKSISLLDTSVLDTTNAEKLIQYMQIKRGYNNRPRLLLNSCSPEKAKRVWPIEIEQLIEGGDKRKENASNTASKNKPDAEEYDATPRLHLTKDYQPVVPLRRMSKRLASQSSVNETSNNTRRDQLSFHPVIASTPNQGKTGADDLISNTSCISHASSSDTIPESVNQSRILSEADTNHKTNTNASKVNKLSLSKTRNATRNTIFAQDNVSENNDNNIEQINAQEQDLRSTQNENACDDDEDEQTLANLSKTLMNNENVNSRSNKTRSGVTSVERHLRVELKRIKAANVSLRRELIQRTLLEKRDSIGASARRTNEFKRISISTPADNNKSRSSSKSRNSIHREISTTAVNYSKETPQQFETDEAMHHVNKTVNEFRKDYGQAPLVVIPIHQSFHNATAAEKYIKTTEHKETEVLERSEKQPTKKQPDKNGKSSRRNTLNSSSDYIRLPSLDDLLTDDEDTPQTSSQPLDLRLNPCKPSEHAETYARSRKTNRSSIRNLNPSDILVDDIISYSQRQRNDKQLHSTKSPGRLTQTRLNDQQESDMNVSQRVPSPDLEMVELNESGSERIVDDIFPGQEPDWHKTLCQNSQKTSEKSVVAKRRGRPRKPKVSTIVTPYLELSKRVNKKKKRTESFAKRKLYSKGRSDDDLDSSGSISFSRENTLSGSSTSTLKNKGKKQNESKEKSDEKITKAESKRKSSYAERKDETEALSKHVDDNDDGMFVRPSTPVARPKRNKKTKNTTTQDDDHLECSQSTEQTVSETNKKKQAKEKKILKQSKNIKRKNSNAANVNNNVEIPLEPISVEPELQDWLGNDISSTSDNFVDNSKKQKHRRRGGLRSNNDRADLVNHNTNIDSDDDGSNTITKQTLIEKKSANNNDEYAEQRENRQNSETNANKAKAQSKAKTRRDAKTASKNKNQEIDALLLEDDDSAQVGLRRSKRTHRPPIQYWTNTGEAQKLIDLKNAEVRNMLKKSERQRVQHKKKNIQSQQLGTEKKQQNDDGDKTVCDLFDQLKENLEETLRKRKESPRISSEKPNKKRLKLTATNENQTEIRKLSCEIMPPPPAPPPQRKKATTKPAQDNSTLDNSSEKSLASSYTRPQNNANAAASSDDGIGTADENIGMSTLAAEPVDTVHSSEKRQQNDGTKDFLLDWLVNNSPPYLQQNRDVFKLLSSDKIKIACIENLVINELNGVEYANYTGKDNNYGYMKFYPNSQKPRSKSKNKEMKLLILVGKLTISLDQKCFNVKNGDFVTIPQGTRYVINNNTDQCSILFFIKI